MRLSRHTNALLAMTASQKNIFIVIAFLLLVASSFLIENIKSNINKEEVKTIQFWHYWSGIEKKPIDTLVEKFNSENHEFKVKALSISMPRKKILTAIIGNVAPDLVHIDGDMVTDFAIRNALSQIDLTKFETEKFNPNFLEMLKINGTQWAMPYVGGAEAMYINKDLLSIWGLKSPETLEELVSIFDQSIQKDDSSIAFIPSWPSWFGGYLPGYFGGSWTDKHGKPTANSKENIEAWQWIEENFVSKIPAEKILSYSEGFGAYQSPDNPFYSGKVAIEASGVWERKLTAIYAPKMNIEVKAFPGKVKNATYLSVNALAIPRNAPHQKEALIFLKWLLKPENVEYLALDQKQFTPYKEHSESFFKKHENEYIKTFIELAKSPNAKFMPQVSYLTRYKKEIKTAYDKVIRKQKTAKEALDELQEKIIQLVSSQNQRH
jgi:multiple sugar transport system substrate-binding protein